MEEKPVPAEDIIAEGIIKESSDKERLDAIDETENNPVNIAAEAEPAVVTYSTGKDFYRGTRGELRLKAEGLFKKAKEKGISIEDISIMTLKENRVDFPGLGTVELPTYVAKVKGRQISGGQVIIDGKQIDYFNRYQKYAADRIENKNYQRDENGRVVREGGRPLINPQPDLTLTDWELFQIGKTLVEDKEFGLEKTITGACDRVIRKIMGENDWLYPEEARLLDEEFNEVQQRIRASEGKQVEDRREAAHPMPAPVIKKASERQINFLKARIKSTGLNPENTEVMKKVLFYLGFRDREVNDLSTSEMSKVIDGVLGVLPRIREETQNLQ